ncbi:MAG: hypothetical protein A2020_14735 [Lentisphaerae bacterium GWF2_45_14]|nr:MAG: hypothetical protein A2020_14735 [Lentisphaerae bacterium GWF2_45_14]
MIKKNSKSIELALKNELLSRKNNKLVQMLRLIWKKPERTRNEIGKALNISKVAVRNDVERLLNYGLVREKTPLKGAGGRRPTPLGLVPELFYSFGIYIRRGWSMLSMLDAESKTVEKIIFHEKFENAAAGLNFMCSQITKLREKYSIGDEKFIGTGISLPGILDQKNGIIISSPSFKKDKDFELGSFMKNKSGSDIVLMNDADLMTLTENFRGKAANMSDFLYFTCGYGLGIFLNGQLYQGHQGGAGEVGYMQLDRTGEKGPDGRNGTLCGIRPFSMLPVIVDKIVKDGGATKVRSYLSEKEPGVTLSMVIRAAKEGDGLSLQIISEYFDLIADAILNLAYIFNPEAIFLDPWTAECPQVTVDIVRRKMGYYGVHNWRLSTEIVSAEYGMEDLSEGAAILPVIKYFEKLQELQRQ